MDAHTGRAIPVEAEELRRPPGHVDDAAPGERPPVVHPKDHAAAVFQVGDADHAGQGKGPVRRRQRIHVEDLAVGRTAAVELGTVPGRDAGFVVAVVHGRVIPGGFDPVRTADLIGCRGLGRFVDLADPLGGMGDELRLRAAPEDRPGQGDHEPTPRIQFSTHCRGHRCRVTPERDKQFIHLLSARQGNRRRARRTSSGSISEWRGNCRRPRTRGRRVLPLKPPRP